MPIDQRNKALSWFHSLPENWQESMLRDAKVASTAAEQVKAAANNHTTKNDIARLMHLYKEPSAQCHWSNIYGVLKRAELDARKSNGEVAEAANPLDCLAEIFNDYSTFMPQNAMVKYVSVNGNPVKKQPYQASTT